MRRKKIKNKEMMRIKQQPVKQTRVCYCKQWINEWVAIRHCEIIQKIKIIEIVGNLFT